MCVSLLIHGGVLSAYYAFRHDPKTERVEFNRDQGLAIEIVRDPVPDTSSIPAPVTIQAAEIQKTLPLSTPPPLATKIKPTAPAAANVLPDVEVKALEVADPMQLDAVEVATKAAAQSVKAPATGNLSAETDSGIPANYLLNPKPIYPIEARRRKQEGLVILAVRVNYDGFPNEVQIVQSSGFQLLDEAAAKAVEQWQFSPARLGNLAVASQIEVPIRFKLTDLK
jgi:protein TonB